MGNLPVIVDPALDVSYPTTYYSGATEADSATPIKLKGGERAEIDVHMEPVPSLHLFFHLPVAGEQTPAAPRLEKQVFDSAENVAPDEVRGDSPGNYEFVGVPAGKYVVRMSGSASGEPGHSSEIRVTKDGQEFDSSTGEPLASLTVSVKMASGDRVPPNLFLSLRDSQMRYAAIQQVDPSGQADFPDLSAGKYTMLATTPNTQYAAVSNFSQPRDFSSSTLAITSGSSQSITVSLVSAEATVEGFVKRSGKPAAGIMVVLVPADAASHLEFFRRDQSDLDGSFTLRNVVPGSYACIAMEDGWTVDWSQPLVLARYTPKGVKLTVGAGSDVLVHLSESVEVQSR